MNSEQRAAYRQAMRGLQGTARELYRAYRAEPTPEGRTLLQVTAELLREVTQRAYGMVWRPMGMVQVDAHGTVIRRSVA